MREPEASRTPHMGTEVMLSGHAGAHVAIDDNSHTAIGGGANSRAASSRAAVGE